jgi:hypothetical protein
MKIKEKLTSRKFWVSFIPAVAGVAQLFGADDTVTALLGALLTLIPSVIYVITEGKLDAKKLTEAAKSLSDVLDSEAADK